MEALEITVPIGVIILDVLASRHWRRREHAQLA